MARMIDGTPEVDDALGLRGDAATANLRMLAMTWRDLLGTRLAMEQRHLDPKIIAEFARLELRVLDQLKSALRKHPMWPWLSQFKGLGGGHTALLLAAIGDPMRFPGQKCTLGHYHAPGLTVGSACPLRIPDIAAEIESTTGDAIQSAGTTDCCREIDGLDGCAGVILTPRPHTGVRSLWHYLGLHADAEGRAPRKRKGQRTTWDPKLKASLLGPKGIAHQIVLQRPDVYRDKYDEAKVRLTKERGIESSAVIDLDGGPANLDGPQIVSAAESLERGGLRPIQIEERARKIAVKAFVGDLLIEWKRISV